MEQAQNETLMTSTRHLQPEPVEEPKIPQEEVKAVTEPAPEPQDEDRTEPENSREYNLRKMREYNEDLKETLERERREKAEIARKYEQQLQSTYAYGRSQNISPETDIADDDYISGKQYKELKKLIVEQTTQQRQMEEIRDVQRRNADIAEVLSPENIHALKKQHPALYASLDAASAHNVAAAMQATYDAIKGMGIYRSEEDYVGANNRKRMQENAQKTRSTATIGGRDESALHTANRAMSGEMTNEEVQMRLNKMATARKKLGLL